MAQDINRLKVELAEKKHTNKWLFEQVVLLFQSNVQYFVFKLESIDEHRKNPLYTCKGFVGDNKIVKQSKKDKLLSKSSMYIK